MKIILVVIVVFPWIIGNSLFAQTNLDSLWGIWESDSAVKTRLTALDNIIWYGYLFQDVDSAIFYSRVMADSARKHDVMVKYGSALMLEAQALTLKGEYREALDVAQSAYRVDSVLDWHVGMAVKLSTIGMIQCDLGNYHDAVNTLNESLYYTDSTNLSGIASTKMSIGIAYKSLGKLSLALEVYQEVLKIAEEQNDTKLLSNVHHNIAVIHWLLDEYEKGREYLQRCMYYQDLDNNLVGIARSHNSIGQMCLELKDYECAFASFEQSLSIFEEVNSVIGKASVHHSLGMSYLEIGEFVAARENFELSLEYGNMLDSEKQIADAFNGLCKLNLELYTKQSAKRIYLEECINYGRKAMSIASKKSNVHVIRDVSLNLFSAFKFRNDYKEALEMHELYIQSRDSLASEENVKELTRFEFKYEYEKKALADSLQTLAEMESLTLNHQLEVAQKETERNLYASGGLVLLLVSFFFFQRRANRNKLLLKEKEANYQREVLYATINSQEDERRRIARDLHDEVGAMLSTIKLNLGAVEMQLKQAGMSEQLTSPARNLVDETISNVRGISKNLLPPTLEEFGLAHALNDLADKVEEASGISFKKDIQPLSQRLPIEHELALFRVIQEMINNALKHAEANEFTLTMHEQNGQLKLSFADNGKGFDLEAMKNSKSGKTGLGLKNLENRVGVAGGELEYESRVGKGTRIDILVPNRIASMVA